MKNFIEMFNNAYNIAYGEMIQAQFKLRDPNKIPIGRPEWIDSGTQPLQSTFAKLGQDTYISFTDKAKHLKLIADLKTLLKQIINDFERYSPDYDGYIKSIQTILKNYNLN